MPSSAVDSQILSTNLESVTTHLAESLSSNPEAYFCDKIGSKCTKRVDRLVRAIEGFVESQYFDRETFADVLAIWSKGCNRSLPRIQRLFRGLRKFEHHFTRLLGLIYFAHEVEHKAGSKDLGQSPGQKRMNAAFFEVATALSIPSEDVKIKYKKSKNYLRILEEDGPGILLQVGVGIDSM